MSLCGFDGTIKRMLYDGGESKEAKEAVLLLKENRTFLQKILSPIEMILCCIMVSLKRTTIVAKKIDSIA